MLERKMERKNNKNKTKITKKGVKKKRKKLDGVVVGNKMEKTVVVEVTTKRSHSLYDKVVKSSKNYKVHTNEKLKIGDKVRIEQCRPISKEKQWRVIEVL